MPQLFGTDGVRGVFGEDLTEDLAFRLGAAFARLFCPEGVVIARDTRHSGPTLERALAEGVYSGGSGASVSGILPTPAVAFLVAYLESESGTGGISISASHNPPEYNGIKLFGEEGRKLDERSEREIERWMDDHPPAFRERGIEVQEFPDGEERYVRHALDALEGKRLDGLKVVIDCSFGAAYRTSPAAFEEAGAKVIALGAEPDGSRINVECGALHPEVAAKAVIEHGADLGLAHDGDADRAIAIDERGEIVDGDGMIAAFAAELKESGRLTGDVVVATVMANLGFRKAMERMGIRIVETPVGDRNVIEAMRLAGAVLGGEQSGHIVFDEFATTGDGLITGLRLAGRMAGTGSRLSELASVVEKYPQLLLNVEVRDPGRAARNEKINKAAKAAEDRLAGDGRVLIRPSGTEPLVRVMVEAGDELTVRSIAEELAAVVEEELGGDA